MALNPAPVDCLIVGLNQTQTLGEILWAKPT
jgi:hypothetical protein